MRLLIMGPPGAGKGTQAASIAARYGVPAISSGDIFRDNIKRHTALGDRVVEIIGRGDFVPDVLTTSLVFHRLIEPDCKKGWLLDGYPRTLAQVEALDIAMRERGTMLAAVISLVAAPEELVSRMLIRARIEGRVDDNEETIRRRIEVYDSETKPILALYRDRGLLVEVDALGTVAEVGEGIRLALDARLATQ